MSVAHCIGLPSTRMSPWGLVIVVVVLIFTLPPLNHLAEVCASVATVWGALSAGPATLASRPNAWVTGLSLGRRRSAGSD